MQLKVSTLLLIAVLGFFSEAFSQQGFVSAGGDANVSGGVLNYSVGLIVFEATSGSEGSLSQGLQIPVVVGLELLEGPEFQVFPNPTEGIVHISSMDSGLDGLLTIFDQKGLEIARMIWSDTIEIKKVDMSSYAPGVYVIHFHSSKSWSKPIKVLKQ